MKKEEKISKLVEELVNVASNPLNKKDATIILSSVTTEDGENVRNIIAATGNIVGCAAIIVLAMEKNEQLRTAFEVANGFYNMKNENSDSSSHFPHGLAALLGTIRK